VSENPDDVTDNTSTEPEPTPEPEVAGPTGVEPETTPPSIPEPEEEVIDVTQGAWKVYNQFIYYNPDLNKWYCLQCREMLGSGKAAGLHAAEVHGFKKKYAKEKVIDSPGHELETDSTVDRSGSTNLEKELFGAGGPTIASVGDTADLALRINADQEAKYVSELVKNPYVNYLYAKMKDHELIFPDWTLADFLREGALIFAASLGCYSEFGQNKDVLRSNKYFAKIAINIRRSWEEFKAEQEFEAQIPKKEEVAV